MPTMRVLEQQDGSTRDKPVRCLRESEAVRG